MKDNLQDLIKYTHGLGVIDLIKITGTDKETKINALSDDRTVVVEGVMHNPVAEFIGTFGMPNLNKLQTILSFDDYDDKAKINVTSRTKEGESIPEAIHFETKAGDFVNDYRLMAKVIVEEKVQNVKFKTPTWNISFEPTIAGIQRLKKQAQANSEEAHFVTKTDGNDLKIYFGDHSTHSGNFVFQAGVNGALSRAWKWPVKVFLSIMDLAGTKEVKFSDAGACEITVDSGIAVYRYILPGQGK
jgi:hypothetical protein